MNGLNMGLSKTAVKTLVECFVNEEVVVFLKSMNVVVADAEGQQIEVSAMLQGFLVHADEDYLYLGLPDGTITRAVSHDTAQMVELSFAQDEFMESQGEGESTH